MSRLIDYKDGDTLLEGFLAVPAQKKAKNPAVIVVHDWSGKNDFSCQKATLLSELGYIGFALDMYGKGKCGETNEEKSALMQPLISDRALLLKRMNAALETVRGMPDVDANKIAVIGFCFGGLCALDLARSGANIAGVVSFHGLLKPPAQGTKQIKAKVLALHGFNDPMVPHQEIVAFGKEMTEAGADWQFHIYGNTVHAFMNPLANDPASGLVFNKVIAGRAWLEMTDFFKEIL